MKRSWSFKSLKSVYSHLSIAFHTNPTQLRENYALEAHLIERLENNNNTSLCKSSTSAIL
jgi:hypothetical protein